MNAFLPARFDELAQRLALGVELLDAGQGLRVARPASVAFDGIPWPAPPRVVGGLEVRDVLERLDRHDSCLHALVYRRGLYRKPPPGQAATVRLRFLSPERRFVPRRLQLELLDPAPIAAADEANPDAGNPAALGSPGRIRQVTLWPGAAYHATRAATGLRGRVRDRTTGQPVRWARVTALASDAAGNPDPTRVVGRAHGDDRGEFLLLLSSDAGGIGPFDATLSVTAHVTVSAAAAVPVATAEQRANDPLWDLPLERVATALRSDPVLRGESLPLTFTRQDTRTIAFPLGRILTSEVPPFTP